jgi:hypothetical protein
MAVGTDETRDARRETRDARRETGSYRVQQERQAQEAIGAPRAPRGARREQRGHLPGTRRVHLVRGEGRDLST